MADHRKRARAWTVTGVLVAIAAGGASLAASDAVSPRPAPKAASQSAPAVR
ncbi:MAG: hypothetical protein JWP73_1715, partial [Phenylobacterium sp.]|nr:hypothetical protein [Phenylobacterium sp.]